MAQQRLPDFLEGADNVYLTKNYIVRQVLEIREHDTEDNAVVSYDTYYKRTLERMLQYKIAFSDKKKCWGKRMPSTLYTRTYVD